RYHRMKGEATLLLPGADHAGFETQVVYEKHLAKEGKSRFDLSREELYKQVWDFVQLNKGNFEQQLRQMGISCDWSRFTFTLDEKIIKTAYATFKRMWDDGLIYRGERLVNFCTHHGTAFADIEVEHKEEKGKLWHIRYPLVNGSGEIVVATTRPETMLGDTAVAVHPSDKRYAKMVGKTVKLPLTHREIPIIADDMVDKSFGSGAVKITPAHDPNDFAVAERHDLPMISVINHEGNMSHEAGESYVNLPVQEARQKVVNDLQDQGFLLKTEDHTHSVGHCYKCGTVIEPLLRDQWFIDMQPLAKEAIKVLKAKKIKFYPEAKRDQLVRYLQGLKDWNISRQIAWGIPIPAFQNADDPDDWIYDERVGEETITVDGKTYHRDPDVFDTWFSSGQWPFATLDYPDGQDFKQFYPLSLMETGGEILQPWVSRMIMLGLYITGEIPFEAVYIHGYVMAEDGAKMSKSVGNVVDPLPVIEKYGSDALRIGIIANRAPAVNRGYDQAKVEGGRNFCNKLWNASRFALMNLEGYAAAPVPADELATEDRWILSRLADVRDEVTRLVDSFQLGEAGRQLYEFLWNEYCDWY
ncbi:valine--tRNA ligase, partial [Candidatus Saccharibacteria bacterium]|nr:valine--tRNA ligase [Candidatus Saccharibacteria bacterium]